MAKAPATSKKPAFLGKGSPAAAPEAAPPAAQSGRFAFTFDEGVAVPEVPPKAKADRLPFRTLFAAAKDRAHLFVPVSYFTAPEAEGGLGRDPEKATVAYVRQKVRDQFSMWKKATAPANDGKTIVLVNREKGDTAGERTFEEPGVSLWVLFNSEPASSPK